MLGFQTNSTRSISSRLVRLDNSHKMCWRHNTTIRGSSEAHLWKSWPELSNCQGCWAHGQSICSCFWRKSLQLQTHHYQTGDVLILEDLLRANIQQVLKRRQIDNDDVFAAEDFFLFARIIYDRRRREDCSRHANSLRPERRLIRDSDYQKKQSEKWNSQPIIGLIMAATCSYIYCQCELTPNRPLLAGRVISHVNMSWVHFVHSTSVLH